MLSGLGWECGLDGEVAGCTGGHGAGLSKMRVREP